MIRTGNDQINTRTYWNYIYTTPAKELSYWTPARRFDEVVEYVKDGDKFIDLGCGVGIPGRTIKKERRGCEVWGVDISDEIIELNTKNDPFSHYYEGHIGALDFLPKKYFDVVFAGEVVEHMQRPEDLFTDAYRILKKGGRLIVTTPQNDRVTSPEHVWYFTEDDVKKFYHDAGFKNMKFVKLDDLDHLMVIFGVATK